MKHSTLLACAGAAILFAFPAAISAQMLVSNGNAGLNPGALVSVSETTGAGTLIGDPTPTGGLPGLAFNSSGTLFGSTGGAGSSSLISINPTTGALVTNFGVITAGIGGTALQIGDLSFQPGSDTLYGLEANGGGGTGGRLWTISTSTAVATLVGNTLTGAGGGLGFAPNGTLYHTGYKVGGGAFALNVLDASNAAVLSSVTLSNYFDGLGVRPSDGALFASPGGADGIFTINAITGADTFIGLTGTGRPSDITFTPNPVPEPLTMSLAGLALAAAARRRVRKSA